MFDKPVFLSAPEIAVGENKLSNDDVIKRITDNYRGNPSDLKHLITGMKMIFHYCASKERYFGTAQDKKPLDYGLDACNKVLNNNNLKASDIDLVIYSGLYKEYFEPAVAMEVAGRLGIETVHAFDLNSACSGLLQSVYTAGLMMQSDKSINKVLLCAVDFPEPAIDYDIQDFKELSTKAAGLTLGSGASAWLLSREVLPKGGLKLANAQNNSYPLHYAICQSPIYGKFMSHNKELFELGRSLIPQTIRSTVHGAGWEIKDLNHVFAHQAGKHIITEMMAELGIDMKNVPVTHTLYGNTVNNTVPMAMDYWLKNAEWKNGDKAVLFGVAAGYSMVTVVGEWFFANE
jgi:3-oxoacyl-[acyl-carrier-protein] synthase III